MRRSFAAGLVAAVLAACAGLTVLAGLIFAARAANAACIPSRTQGCISAGESITSSGADQQPRLTCSFPAL